MNTTLRSVRTLAAIASALAVVSTGHAAITSNAITSNALTNNAITSNAITSNALTNNALTVQGSATQPATPTGAYTPSASWKVQAISVDMRPAVAR